MHSLGLSASRWLHRAASDGADDWEIYTARSGSQYAATRSQMAAPLWCEPLFVPPVSAAPPSESADSACATAPPPPPPPDEQEGEDNQTGGGTTGRSGHAGAAMRHDRHPGGGGEEEEAEYRHEEMAISRATNNTPPCQKGPVRRAS